MLKKNSRNLRQKLWAVYVHLLVLLSSLACNPFDGCNLSCRWWKCVHWLQNIKISQLRSDTRVWPLSPGNQTTSRFLIFWTFYAISLQNDISHVSLNRNPYQLKNIFKKNKKFFRTSNSFCICVLMCWCAHLQDGKPPPKNMLKRSSGVMSASKPLWKSKPAPCEWLGLLGSSPPVRSYCRRLSALLSTAYALPISRKESRVSRMELENLFFSFSSSKIFIFI